MQKLRKPLLKKFYGAEEKPKYQNSTDFLTDPVAYKRKHAPHKMSREFV